MPPRELEPERPCLAPAAGAPLGAPPGPGAHLPRLPTPPLQEKIGGGRREGTLARSGGELHRLPSRHAAAPSRGLLPPTGLEKEMKVYCYRNRNAVGQTDGAVGRKASLAKYFGLRCLVSTDPPLELRRQAGEQQSPRVHLPARPGAWQVPSSDPKLKHFCP